LYQKKEIPFCPSKAIDSESAYKTIQIKWEDLQVRFYDGDFTVLQQEEEGGEK
jgi:hypothetical protein